MADKKYIVKQTVDYAGRGEKTATVTIPCGSDAELTALIENLDGKVEVYEMSATLGNSTGATASTSLVVSDKIVMRKRGAESVYISAYKRPLVFKSSVNVNNLSESLKLIFKPFEGAMAAENPSDISFDTGNPNTL